MNLSASFAIVLRRQWRESCEGSRARRPVTPCPTRDPLSLKQQVNELGLDNCPGESVDDDAVPVLGLGKLLQ